MRRRSARRSLLRAGKEVALALVAIWSAGPILMMVLASFRPDREIFDPRQSTITPTLVNYRNLARNWAEFFDGLSNSAVIAAGSAVVAVLTSALAGYAYSRLRRRWMAGSAAGLIVLRLIPPIVLTLPLFPIVAFLRLSDTHLVLILLYATFFVSLGTIVMRTFMDQVPREMDEAALVDWRGAGAAAHAGDRTPRGARDGGGRDLRRRLRVER